MEVPSSVTVVFKPLLLETYIGLARLFAPSFTVSPVSVRVTSVTPSYAVPLDLFPITITVYGSCIEY